MPCLLRNLSKWFRRCSCFSVPLLSLLTGLSSNCSCLFSKACSLISLRPLCMRTFTFCYSLFTKFLNISCRIFSIRCFSLRSSTHWFFYKLKSFEIFGWFPNSYYVFLLLLGSLNGSFPLLTVVPSYFWLEIRLYSSALNFVSSVTRLLSSNMVSSASVCRSWLCISNFW